MTIAVFVAVDGSRVAGWARARARAWSWSWSWSWALPFSLERVVSFVCRIFSSFLWLLRENSFKVERNFSFTSVLACVCVCGCVGVSTPVARCPLPAARLSFTVYLDALYEILLVQRQTKCV